MVPVQSNDSSIILCDYIISINEMNDNIVIRGMREALEILSYKVHALLLKFIILFVGKVRLITHEYS